MINFDSIIYYQTFTWPTHDELTVEKNNTIADFLKKIYEDGIFGEIEKLITCGQFKKQINNRDFCCVGVGHIVLMAVCSAIDSLGAYAEGTGIKNVGLRFKKFISTYFPAIYKNKEQNIYDSFRCGSVHEWNLFKGNMIGLRNDPDHLKEENGILHISLVDFFSDLKIAFQKYYEAIQKDNNIKDNLLARYRELKGRDETI
jgi:hypothetical protein